MCHKGLICECWKHMQQHHETAGPYFSLPLVSGESLEGGKIQNASILTRFESLVLQACEDFTDEMFKGPFVIRVLENS